MSVISLHSEKIKTFPDVGHCVIMFENLYLIYEYLDIYMCL